MKFSDPFSILILAFMSIGCHSPKSNSEVVPESIVRDSVFKFEVTKESNPNWSKENTVVFHVLGEPDDMHPLNGGSALGRLIQSYTQGYLVRPDQDGSGSFVPSMVTSSPEISNDGLNYTYELRENLKWDDGSKVRVEDVIFGLKAAKCPLINNPHYKPYIRALKNVLLDESQPRRFTLVLEEPNLLNVGFLSIFPMMQEAFWDTSLILRQYTLADFDLPLEKFDDHDELNKWASATNDSKYGHNPEFLVGLGPYQFSEWKPGQSFTLTKKIDHWSNGSSNEGLFERGYPDKIIFKINRDPSSQLLEFKSQVYDGSSSLNTATFLELTGDTAFLRNYNSTEARSYTYGYLGFNCKPDGVEHKKLFNDVRVRKAVTAAIPYDAINQVLYRGRYSRVVGAVSPLKDEYNDDLELIGYNLEVAKMMLDSSGWTDTDGDNIRDKMVDGERIPLRFDLNYMSSPATWKDMALMISESLWEIGVKSEPVPMTFAVLKQKNGAHDFDAALGAWAGSSFPEDFTQVWHSRSWLNNGSNYVGFGDQDSDLLIDSIKRTVNQDERIRLVKRFQEMVYEDQPYAFLFSFTKKAVAHKRFNNVSVYSDHPHLMINNWQLVGVSDSQLSN